MNYTIGEVSEMLNIPVSTLRYYDSQKLLLDLKRDDTGNRIFDETNINALKLINCLKTSGISIKDIKKFMLLAKQGDKTISERKNFFLIQKQNIKDKINELEKAMNMVEYKYWYYQTAEKDKTEKYVKNINIKDMPKNIQEAYKNSHEL